MKVINFMGQRKLAMLFSVLLLLSPLALWPPGS